MKNREVRNEIITNKDWTTEIKDEDIENKKKQMEENKNNLVKNDYLNSKMPISNTTIIKKEQVETDKNNNQPNTN